MASGVLFVVPPLLGGYFPQAYASWPLPPMEVLLVVALLLVPLGMLGFHALQKHYYGSIGRAGFWMAVVAPLAVALGAASALWGGGEALGLALLGLLVFVVGFMLYGVAVFQARVLPRWCGVVFIVAVPAALASSIPLPFIQMFIVFGLGWFALGCALLSHRVASTERPSHVR
jgi:hypothetical protein